MLRTLLSLSVLLAAACGSETVVQPERPEPIAALELRPAVATLKNVAPGNTVQLSVLAWDQAGAQLSGTGGTRYSSDAPAIAEVSSSGRVIAIAPGRATIQATLTLGGSTRTASMTVRVRRDYSDVAGVYDLTARVTGFDPAWGYDLSGYRYTAVLTLSGGEPPALGGTFTSLWLVGPAGDSSLVADTGLVVSATDDHASDVIELRRGGTAPFTLTLAVGTVASGLLSGDFGAGGHISGPFEARRR